MLKIVGGPWVTTIMQAEANLDLLRGIKDNEAFHCFEDRFHQSVLRSIAEGKCEDPPAHIAAVALRSLEIEVTRWYA